MKKFLIYSLLLIVTSTVNAQNFPVQSTVFIAPPYSVYLSDYASASSQKMMVNLLLKDVLQQGVQVKLRITIKGNGIELRSKPEYTPPPLILSGGVPLQVSGTDLESYLLPANLNFSGLDKQEFLKTGKLPEGVYQFMVEAVEYRRDVAISNQGMTIGWLVLNDPPRWTLPMANSLLTATYPQNVFFSWMPMNTSSPNSAFSTEYEFTLVEVWPADRNPNDAINSTVPLYQTTTNNTSLLYGPGEPELSPGRKYVCRLRAKDTEGRDLFKNHGYSEILTFTFGMACKPPNTINHTVQSDEQARVDWISLPGNDQFILSYSEKNNDGTWSSWYNNETMMPWSNIDGLKADHTYRYRLQATCGTLQSDYSETKEFNTPKKDTSEIECGADLSIPVIDGSPPLQNLKPGDMINVGGFDAKVYEASGSNGTFSGKCVVHVKTFKFWVQSEFTDICINQSMQVTSGTINAIKGKLHLLNIDAVMDSINNYLDDKNDENNGNPNVGDPYVPGDPITVIIDGETIVVTGDTTFTTADGTEVVVTLSGQPPIIIVDGKTTEVTTDVLDFDNPGGTGNDGTHLVADSSPHSINYVQFKAYQDPNGNHFGFDAYPSEIPEILSEYDKEKVLDKDYIIPWQSAEANGMPTLVNMLIDTKVPDSIQTRLKVEMKGMPLTFTASPDGDTIRVLSLTGQGEKDKDLITASYLNDEGKEIPIGFLNLISYKKQELKLVIVPVDGEFKYNVSALQTYLNQVYAPAITTWNVSLATEKLNVEYDEDEKNGLNTSRSFLSSFNKEMNAIIDAMKARGEYSKDDKTYYLFVMDKAEKESLNGLMPFSSNFGFIFTGEGPDETKLFRTMAHELGHGAFKLKHIFDDKGTEKQATLNLMDYTTVPDKAIVLHKYQWDEIIDPRLIAFGWSEEMYEELPCFAIFDECDQVEVLLERIKKYSSENKKFIIKTFPDTKERHLRAISIKIGDTEYKQIRIIFIPSKEKVTYFDPNKYNDYMQYHTGNEVISDKRFGIVYTIDNKYSFWILIDNEKDEVGKREALKKYLFGDHVNDQNSDLSDYKEIEEKIFGDIKKGDETEIVIPKRNYSDDTGNFMDQYKSEYDKVTNKLIKEGCDCYCMSSRYAGSSPQITNYLFSKVCYKSTSEVATLKNSGSEFEVGISSVNSSGFNKTLKETKEIVTFERSRIIGAIIELNNRLEQSLPTIIGVSYGAKKGPYNEKGLTTDHYMVIVSKGRDKDGKIYFRYLDPATSHGDEPERRLTINEDLTITDKCTSYRKGDTYYLVELRLDKKIISCIEKPDVDNLLRKMKEKYKKNSAYSFDEVNQSF